MQKKGKNSERKKENSHEEVSVTSVKLDGEAVTVYLCFDTTDPKIKNVNLYQQSIYFYSKLSRLLLLSYIKENLGGKTCTVSESLNIILYGKTQTLKVTRILTNNTQDSGEETGIYLITKK